jgi:ubiquinone/menaquinone biosynthesis C-methylase UbiE
VIGSDINTKMLKIAREKSKKKKLDISFIKGNMRSINVGVFGAVITIFNSIGHLTKLDFEKAIRNRGNNLKDGDKTDRVITIAMKQ